MKTFKEGGPISKEEREACERLADAIIDVCLLSAHRMQVSGLSRVRAFFQVAPLGAWEHATVERYIERNYSNHTLEDV